MIACWTVDKMGAASGTSVETRVDTTAPVEQRLHKGGGAKLDKTQQKTFAPFAAHSAAGLKQQPRSRSWGDEPREEQRTETGAIRVRTRHP